MKTVIDNYEFITFKASGAEFIFSTSKNNLDFNFRSAEGKANLKLLCNNFNLLDVGYGKQIHSDVVNVYDGNVKEGDAVITDKKDIGIGIFTADCVPVLIYDKNKKAAAAVHSGWQGTYKSISSKTVKIMEDRFDSKADDLIVYIGPHNRSCCYEFGYDNACKYFGEYIKKDPSVYADNKLDLEKCIIKQLKGAGIPEKNINTLNLCTYCCNEYEFFSYRREKDKNYGRNFSFVVIRWIKKCLMEHGARVRGRFKI